jgi:serine/threonine protein kinase
MLLVRRGLVNIQIQAFGGLLSEIPQRNLLAEEPERKLGPYTLVSKIGRGAFGVVWLAEKRSSIATTRFALKLPRDEDIDLEAFKQEATIWLQASGHPNVVPMIEADVYDEQVVIVSEYVTDGSLAAWLRQHGGLTGEKYDVGRNGSAGVW